MKVSTILKYIVTAFLAFIIVYLSCNFPLFNAELIFLYMVIIMIIIYLYAGKKVRYMIQLSFFWGIIYAFVIISLRSISRNHAILIGFPTIVLFTWGFTYCYRKKLSKKNIFIMLLMTLIFLEGPVRIINFSGTLISLPSFIFNLVAILIGCMLFFSRYNRIIWLSFGGVLGCAVWMFCQGGDMWAHKVVHGTYTGKIYRLANDYFLYDEKGDTLFLSQLKGKIVLLDFWSNGCGVCWEKFPMMQDLYDKYKNENVFIAGVFVEKKEGEYEENMKKFSCKYTFPIFKVSKDASLVKDLSVKRFPSLAVLDTDGVFRGFGNIEIVIKMFNNMVDTEKGKNDK
ncbi:TlpA family protein disulfide reductase [Bacteroides acidifaciens]|uniref:TlpA family protein disulfide reductase n=1 Tax=Bacteroides acidifaciens TaxID=85831 RepID=A0A3L8AFC1_9BACE|nr:TlpA disulfide reductase family protein [Bacteroides acidifaciens]RLT81000.1 TlpA family protein disulfide reductase [Bacteroides acidifaciens]